MREAETERERVRQTERQRVFERGRDRERVRERQRESEREGERKSVRDRETESLVLTSSRPRTTLGRIIHSSTNSKSWLFAPWFTGFQTCSAKNTLVTNPCNPAKNFEVFVCARRFPRALDYTQKQGFLSASKLHILIIQVGLHLFAIQIFNTPITNKV